MRLNGVGYFDRSISYTSVKISQKTDFNPLVVGLLIFLNL